MTDLIDMKNSYVSYKIVSKDGSPVTPAMIADARRRVNEIVHNALTDNMERIEEIEDVETREYPIYFDDTEMFKWKFTWKMKGPRKDIMRFKNEPRYPIPLKEFFISPDKPKCITFDKTNFWINGKGEILFMSPENSNDTSRFENYLKLAKEIRKNNTYKAILATIKRLETLKAYEDFIKEHK